MGMDDKVQNSIDTLISSIKSTDKYLEFDEIRRKVILDSDLCNKIERAKEVRKQIDSLSLEDQNGEIGDRLDDEYLELTEDTNVHNYMMAEFGVCSILQTVLKEVVGNIDIELREK